MIPEQRAPINRIPHSPHQAYETYLRLPKLFTEPHFEDLRNLGERMSKSNYTIHQRAAASAFRESAVAFGRSDYYLETQLGYLDRSDELLKKALVGETTRLESNPRTFPSVLIRIQAELNLSNLYEDIVYGEVTDLTREELYASRLAIFDTIAEMREQFADNNDYLTDLAGVELERIYELIIALGDNPYEQTLLAPFRGDNGQFEGDTTHDLIHVQFDTDYEVADVDPIEAKSVIDAATERRYRTQRVNVVSAQSLHLRSLKSHAAIIQKLHDPAPHLEELQALRHDILHGQNTLAHAS